MKAATTVLDQGEANRGVAVPEGGRVSGRFAGREVDICAGPGGTAMGNQILGRAPMIGVELDGDACATGRAAGFDRRRHDMRLLAPARHRGIRGAVLTPPCPTFSASGKGSGRRDIQELLDAVTCFGMGCTCSWSDLPHYVEDIRTALVVETARWALTAPDLEWLVAEEAWQVAPLWEDIAAEAHANEWNFADVIELDAADYGLPVRRRRSFLIARRDRSPRVTEHDAGTRGSELPRYTMAGVLGLDPGTRVWTRNNRQGGGGNVFSADGASWSLTGSSRSWKLGAVDGPELTAAQAGYLQGFPADYPWQGSRTAQFRQLADVVHPVMSAVAIGIATDTPWVDPVRDYLHALYGPGAEPAPAVVPAPRAPTYEQLSLV
jgi:DNA (cytosine-5)-methyltransferase 1